MSEIPADLVLFGGVVRTLDGEKTASAIAARKGRIVRVGSDAEVKALATDRSQVIDLAGRTVVPGLIDSHMHLFGLGRMSQEVDLVGTKSVKEIQERVAKAVKESSGSWIQGRGWDQNDWEGAKAFPSARDLDAVSLDRPIVLRRIDGHAIWVNGAALKAAGVTAKTPDPAGGKIVRERGEPTGIFIDNAMNLVEAKLPQPTIEELEKQALAGERACLEAGLVAVHDMGLGRAELEALRRLDDAGRLHLRVYAMVDGGAEDLAALFGDGPRIPKDETSRLTIRGVKFFMDGALGSRGAALLAPYADDPKNSGLVLMELGEYESRVRLAKERGFQVSTHAIGDRANRSTLDVYERVFGSELRAARPRVEHAQVVSLEDLPRFSKLGVIASMQPTHATSDMPWAEKRVGPERIKGAYAWKTLLSSGATIASGSDAPVESISPILGLYAAMTRQEPTEKPAPPWRGDERMTPLEALQSFTGAGAFASFREGEAGVLKEGFVADMTVLDRDPLAIDPHALLDAKVELTIVGGSIAFSKN
jgi:predicted amidohydrolase YtcJ